MKNEEIQSKHTLLMIGIIFVAFTLRPAITSIGPLTGHIRAETGISNGLAGLLTTLPLIAFGLISPFVPGIARRFGNEMSVLIGLLILGAGIMIRSADTIVLLFSGTIFIGLGIAVCNVLLPGIVKQSFPKKVGLLTGIYTLSMGVFAGLAPGLSIPLADTLNLGWRMSLGMWTIIIITAIGFWLPQLKIKQTSLKSPTQNKSTSPIWFSSLAWQVTFFMGLQSMVYFSVTSWLPEILLSRGFEIAVAGWMVTLFQFSGLPANIIIPVLADRLPHQKGIALGIGILCLAGLAGLIFSTNKIIIICCIIMLGIALGAAISHGLTLIGLRAANAKQASDLSGMAQSVGYILAAMGPFIIGFLFDFFQSWTIPLILLIFITVLYTIAGIGAGRNLYVLQEKPQKNQQSPSTIA
ncbi:MFS transporter [Bacillus sp. S/N-304-OC-R1]|uniref:CynX/NimT family MFS transporter n=1 Tax=Bacillus sp. S/N-304-OC-R1 TaxID=2758034 RepID=UPI0021B0260D|nr:MFS transporter [Bacillus sp. S/N-304-OC-R1]